MLQKSNEKWKHVIGRESFYMVSSIGDIYSFAHKKILKPFIDKKGYLNFKLKNIDGTCSTVKCHRIVAEAFIPNKKNKPQINHINGKKEDNRIENLEWCTCQENIIAAYRTNLKSNKGEKHPNSIFSNNEVIEIRKLRDWGVTTKDIASIYKTKYDTMWKIVKNINYLIS